MVFTFNQLLRWVQNIVVTVCIVSIVANLGLLGFFLFQDDIAEELTTGRRPDQYYGQLASDLLDDYGDVLSIGHNSGGSMAATRQALDHNADVIEIDVVGLNGELYAGHFPPLPLIGQRLFRGPTLEEVWALTDGRTFVKFDLKESSPEYLNLVFAFLAQHRGERQVIVSSRDVTVLAAFAALEPGTIRLLSIPDQRRLETFRESRFGIDTIDGVSIRESLIDEELFHWLEAERLLVIAWTVNELPRVNILVRLGVHGITTDNLAIMELLGRGAAGREQLPNRFPLP